MRNCSEIIRNMRECATQDCRECGVCVHRDTSGDCVFMLVSEACRALEDMQARCARYAEEIMMMREAMRREGRNVCT